MSQLNALTVITRTFNFLVSKLPAFCGVVSDAIKCSRVCDAVSVFWKYTEMKA